MNDAAALLSGAHAEVKEKLEVLRTLLPVIGDTEVWSKAGKVLEYFNFTVVRHFRHEELLAELVGREAPFTPEETEVTARLTQEHGALLRRLEKINEASLRYPTRTRESKETFIGAASDFIEDLITHADKEDRLLFPLLRKKLPPDRLRTLVEEAASRVR